MRINEVFFHREIPTFFLQKMVGLCLQDLNTVIVASLDAFYPLGRDDFIMLTINISITTSGINR